MSKYLLRCNDDGSVEIYDVATGETKEGPMSWALAQRRVLVLNDAPAAADPRVERVAGIIVKHSMLIYDRPQEQHLREAERFCAMIDAALERGK